MMISCYCKSNLKYANCCQPYLEKKDFARTPEQLMRSRYSAFVTHDMQYIYETMAQSKVFTSQNIPAPLKWINLEVLNSSDHSDVGYVEFKAYYLDHDRLNCLHEKSSFVKLDGRWIYQAGDLIPEPTLKILRNDSCPCGSGRKFKKCCFS